MLESLSAKESPFLGFITFLTMQGKVREILEKDSIIIIGGGHFGSRALNILSCSHEGYGSIILIEKDRGRIQGIREQGIILLEYDGIRFIIDYIDSMNPGNIIVPAIPEHLALEWLLVYLREKQGVIFEKIRIPNSIKAQLPYTWDGSEESLLVSYADFRCPDDCPEPEDHCTVTGERRDLSLFELLSSITIDGYGTHIIRSHQLAPGVGGYKAGELLRLFDRVMQEKVNKWMIGTACRCHGILTCIEKICP